MIIKLKAIVSLLALLVLFNGVQAQTTKKKTTVTKKTTVVKQRKYNPEATFSNVSDLTENDPSYSSVKNLMEQDSVILLYEDNSFKAKEALKRGDFVISFNSALRAIEMYKRASGVDTSVVNTYDRNRGGKYLTTVSQVSDINESSVYYPASRSLIERWGIAAPFTASKTLSPNSTMTEKEVYDILRVTLGYKSAAINPYAGAMNRQKFAIALNNAVTQKMEQIHALQVEAAARREAERRYQQSIINSQDSLRRNLDSNEIQRRKVQALQQEIEARRRLDSTRRQ